MSETQRRSFRPIFKLFPEQWDLDSILGEAWKVILTILLPHVDHLVIHYPTLVIIVLLPLSVFYEVWHHLRRKIVFMINTSPGKHKEKVLKIQQQVRGQLCQTSQSSADCKTNTVQRDLVDILEIDVDRQIVRKEFQIF